MSPFRTVHAVGTPANTLVRRCLSHAGPVAEDVTLGLVYATEAAAEALPQLLAELRAAAPNTYWAGAVGAGIVADDREIYDEPALSLLLCQFPREHFIRLPRMQSGLETALMALERWHGRGEGGLALLHGDASDPRIPQLLDQLRHRLPQIALAGGLAGTHAEAPLIDTEPQRGGLRGLLLDAALPALCDHSQGCVRIGQQREITLAQRNLLIELDGRPALEVMLHEIGEVLARDLRRTAGYIFVGLPIEGGASDDYLVRNLVGIDEQHQLLAVGDSLDNQRQLMFCRRDGNTAREDLRAMCRRLRDRLAGRRIRAGIYVSCIARGRSQFGPDNAELAILREELGEFPLSGFFANGEIYNGRLYGYTGVLTLFPEGIL